MAKGRKSVQKLPPAAVIGLLLMALSLCLCLLSLRGAPTGLRRTFPAAGVERLPEKPKMPGGTVRINEADAEELMQLPGIGEALAAAIIDERETNGPFIYPEDLMAVRGIGESKFRNILPYLNFDEEGE